MDSQLAEKNEKEIRAYSDSFKGMYSKAKSEISGTGENDNELVQSFLLSLYFLIPRDSLGDFRRAFADLKARELQCSSKRPLAAIQLCAAFRFSHSGFGRHGALKM